MNWINLAQDRDKSRAFVEMVMNPPQDPENVGNTTCCETGRLSGRTLVCGVNFFFFFMAQQPQWAKAFLLLWFLNHTRFDAPHSVGLLWASGQPIAEPAT
jgi:hypothetical protein